MEATAGRLAGVGEAPAGGSAAEAARLPAHETAAATVSFGNQAWFSFQK